MTELQSGVVLGRYELLVRIGRGGMASVWVARERSTVSGKQRLVAVKAMLPELAAHSEFRSMFLGEVQIIQAINHAHVVQVYEVSEDHGTLYMAMEWVEGESLRNMIKAAKARGALPAEIAVRIAADAAAGLHAAHELRGWDGELRGVVHCDVSPHNVLVGIDGKAKLVDFGIANALGRLEPSNDGERIKGKLSYMSPEQARGTKVDRRTDVFALGIVLFEMTTGEQLFKGRDPAHTLELVRSGSIPLPTSLNPRYPKGLEPIVMRALDRDPDRRFQTAEEFERALTTFLYDERILVSHSAVAQLLMRVTGPRIERRREVITKIIQAVDGQLQTGEVGTHQLAALADLSPPQNDPFNYTLTNAGDELALGIAARLESQTVVGHPILQRQAVPQRQEIAQPLDDEPVLIEPDEPRRVPWLWIAVAAAVLVVAGLAYGLLSGASRAQATQIALQQQASASAAAATQARGAGANADQPHDRAQSAESLPVASDPGHADTPARWRRAPRSRDSRRPAIDLDSLENDSTGKSETTSETADKEAPAAPEGINRSAANSALAAAAAAASRGCRRPGESPTGAGNVTVTFAPDGSASAVTLSQRFKGTTIGSCVAGHFRQARVPAYQGEPTTVPYTFEVPE